eukprot:14526226-Alexandrium_andersonii.AAC.1
MCGTANSCNEGASAPAPVLAEVVAVVPPTIPSVPTPRLAEGVDDPVIGLRVPWAGSVAEVTAWTTWELVGGVGVPPPAPLAREARGPPNPS